MGLDREAPDSLHDRMVPAGIVLPTQFASQGDQLFSQEDAASRRDRLGRRPRQLEQGVGPYAPPILRRERSARCDGGGRA